MKRLTTIIIFAIFLAISSSTAPVQAGEPTGVIGPMNPTMFKCVTKTRTTLTQTDPWRKPTIDFRVEGGELVHLAMVEDYIREFPDVQGKMCIEHTDYDFGFDTKDAAQFNLYLNEIKRDCNNKDGHLEPITNTRIEGAVYEFHPRDYGNPDGEWFAVPSKQVSIRASGITFNSYWVSDDNGWYRFPNQFGAGPITLNLQLPPDAHAINPDVVLFSTGGTLQVSDGGGVAEDIEVWTVFLGFYRGDNPPPDVFKLRTPDGNYLPFLTLGDVENMGLCGVTDLPTVEDLFAMYQLPPPTTEELQSLPNVGGVLPPDKPISIILIALITLIGLPAAGILRLRRRL